MGYIYKITNNKSGKIYIGKTTQNDPHARWKEHKYMFRQEKGGCPALRDAVRAYGIDAFMFEILIICFDEDCNRWEQEYIKKFDCMVPNGYNILEGGQGGAGFRGKTHSEETKKKIVAATKKRCEDPEYIKRLRDNTTLQMANVDRKEYGKKITGSEKYKKAMAEGRIGGRAHKDGKLSEETKDKISISVSNYYEDDTSIVKHRNVMAKAKGKKVDQFDKDGKFIKTYISIAEAARETNVAKAGIQFVLRGQHKTAGGFIWKHHVNVENEIIYDS
jgi:group I intron endonuclease